MSDAYMAKPPSNLALPQYICLKIATDKLDIFPGMYTETSVKLEFLYQRKILMECRHRFIVECYEDVLPDVQDVLATELGITNVQFLQLVGLAYADKHKIASTEFGCFRLSMIK